MYNLKDYGFLPNMLPEGAAGIPARVTAVHRERYALVCEHGEVFGRLKSSEYYDRSGESFPTTGDFVLIDYNAAGDSRILATLPRKSFFSRHDPTPGRGEQAVAANFDYVFILQSLNHDLNVRRMERYLTQAWQSGAVPVVVLTKADLVEDAQEAIQMIEDVAVGVDVFAVSARTGEGLKALESYLKPGKTLVLLGSSGVGKSSLVNALAGKEIMTTGEIREDDSKGRHTTTHRQLITLESGVMIIDTPGMRQLGMWDVSEGLGETFADVEALLGHCRFSDCRHESEPGCAIRTALESGELSVKRWESYRSLRSEARYTDDPDSYRRKKRERNKAIAQNSRRMKKKGKIRK